MENQAFHRKTTQIRGNGVAGNALWFILVAIALLAALTLTLTRNSSNMATNLDEEQARTLAERSFRTLNTYQSVVNKLIMSGCSESEISFETADRPGYANPGAPADKHCHVFDVAGGGLTPIPADDGSTDPSVGLSWKWQFTGDISIPGLGPESATETTCSSDCSELIAFKPAITREVCLAYNRLAGFNTANNGEPYNDPSDTVTLGTEFTGNYTQGTNGNQKIETGGGDASSAMYGVPTACYYTGGNPSLYRIYRVLYTR